MPHLDARALEMDPEGCVAVSELIRGGRSGHLPGLLHHATTRLRHLWRRTKRSQAHAQIRELLAAHSVLELHAIAETAHLSLRRTRAVVEWLELRGDVLVHATRGGSTPSCGCLRHKSTCRLATA
jgi:hypothetical protein